MIARLSHRRDRGNAMPGPQPKYTKDEHARRGTAVYEQQVRPQVEAGNRGRLAAVDIDTGAFEVADDTLTASRQLLARHPNAQIWCVRIGYPAVRRFGPRVRAE
jgi:hypothetical protein